jgi:hypothetical protein
MQVIKIIELNELRLNGLALKIFIEICEKVMKLMLRNMEKRIPL